MKKIILLTSFCLATHCFADQLNRFDDVKNAAISGKSLHFVVDFAQCHFSKQSASMLAPIGVFTPSEVMITDHLTASFTHFTLSNPSFLNKPVFEHVKYVLTTDGNMSLTSQVLDATTYAPLSKVFTVNCPLDNGVKIYD